MSENIYEALACDYLRSKGLTVIERNYAWPGGEIDIILFDKQELVFAEVKYRKSDDFGCPLEKITPQQVRRIHNTAAYFLENATNYDKTLFRFDAIGITPSSERPSDDVSHALYPPEIFGEYQIEWIENAF